MGGVSTRPLSTFNLAQRIDNSNFSGPLGCGMYSSVAHGQLRGVIYVNGTM